MEGQGKKQYVGPPAPPKGINQSKLTVPLLGLLGFPIFCLIIILGIVILFKPMMWFNALIL